MGDGGHNIYRDQLGETSVRLLCVQIRRPDKIREPALSCQLATFSLSNSPSYVALSYAWHEPQIFQNPAASRNDEATVESWRVRVDQQDVAVRPNLFYALNHLATNPASGGVCHYWIDALCIDQSNDAERTSQVSIMHQIYRKASRVLVWLGPDLTLEAYNVREFFRALLQKYYTEADFGTSYDDSSMPIAGMKAKKYQTDFLGGDDEQALDAAGFPPLGTEIWAQVVRFWDRNWFSRVWVQQEVALAQKLEFWCGEVQFEQIDLVETSRFFVMSSLSNTLLPLRSGTYPRLKSTGGRLIGASAVRIEDLRMFASGSTLENGIHLMEAEDFRQGADRLTGPSARLGVEDKYFLLRHFAVHLFLSFRDDASDPKDKVFALLVYMKQAAEAYGASEVPLRVDYSKNMDQVYREAAAWVIEASGWLGMLALLHPRRVLTDHPSWPSWVPDFRSPPPRCMRVFATDMPDRIRAYYESITLDTKPTLSSDRYQLAISTKRIAIVSDIGDTYETMVDDGSFELCARLLLRCPTVVNAQGKTRIDVWMDTLSGCEGPLPSNPDRRAFFKHWLSFFILRKVQTEFREGRITRGGEFLYKMLMFEELAKSDESETLPTWSYWTDTLSSPERASGILNHRPGNFETIEIDGRRLFRLTHLGFPHCPSATLIGLGPEDIKVGDEVHAVVGSAMPLVLRRSASHAQAVGKCCPEAEEASMPRVVVGEAYMSGFDEILEDMCDIEWQRMEIQ